MVATSEVPGTRAVPQLEEDGFVILRSFFEPQVVSGVIDEMKALVDEEARKRFDARLIPALFENEPFDRRLIRLFEKNPEEAPRRWRENLHRPGMFPMFFHPRLLDLVESVLGPEVRLYPNYTVRPKLPDDAKTEVLWHQDGGYTVKASGDSDEGVDKLRMVNVWSPLVPTRRHNGCMQFIAKTHTLGVVPHRKEQYYLQIEDEHLNPWLDKAVDIEMDPGDVVLFNNLLFHMGLPNKSGTVRWSVDWRYQDATQSTLRGRSGHIARSRAHPENEVKSAEQWARLTF